MATGPIQYVLKVEGMVEYQYAVRKLFADALRAIAEDEAPATAARLRAKADRFEMGLAEDE